MILDLLFWLPIKMTRLFLQPVTAMLEDLANATEAAIKDYEEEHGL